MGNGKKPKVMDGFNHATFNRQPSALVTLLIVIKPGLPFSERDLYRLARVTPAFFATSVIPMALAAVFSAWIKSDSSPVAATSFRKSRISSVVFKCSAISNF